MSAPDLRLSVSKTKLFIDCKKKYHFTYIQKLPRKDWEHHTLGKFAHKILEDFHLAYMNGSTEPFHLIMTKSFKDAQEEYKDKLTKEMVKECKEMMMEYLQIITKQSNEGQFPNIVGIEKNFEITVKDKLVLNGMIDRIQIDQDGVIHVADYKTTKNKKYLEGDFFQLLTYAFVIVSENPAIDKVRASYILLRHNFEYITEEFNLNQILEIKDKYIEYADSINTETEYPANPSFLCKFCDHLDLCAEGKQKIAPQTIYGEVEW